MVATNRDLAQDVKNGRFRQDLYQRLKTLEIHVPPLRERQQDIPALAEHFLKTESQHHGVKNGGLSSQAFTLLQGYHWPGNIRELKGVIIHALLLAQGDIVLPIHLPPELQENHERPRYLSEEDSNAQEHLTVSFPIGRPLKEVEQGFILKTLAWMNGNRTKTADVLKIGVRTLRNKLKTYATP